jgi:hypothetical protein
MPEKTNLKNQPQLRGDMSAANSSRLTNGSKQQLQMPNLDDPRA